MTTPNRRVVKDSLTTLIRDACTCLLGVVGIAMILVAWVVAMAVAMAYPIQENWR